MARKALSKQTRFEVFKRDEFACQYCGRTPPAVMLEIDHITPVSKGGDNEQINLITSCQDCNRGKSDRELTVVPESLKNQMEEQQERRRQVEAYNEFLMQIRESQLRDVEDFGVYWYNKFEKAKGEYVFGEARAASIKRFLEKLPKAEILDAMDTAHARVMAYKNSDQNTFRYFCGICWSKIKESAGDA